jgi:hypothetical protein
MLMGNFHFRVAFIRSNPLSDLSPSRSGRSLRINMDSEKLLYFQQLAQAWGFALQDGLSYIAAERLLNRQLCLSCENVDSS